MSEVVRELDQDTERDGDEADRKWERSQIICFNLSPKCVYIISEKGLYQIRYGIPKRLRVELKRAASVDDTQKEILANNLTSLDPCCPSYHLQQPHGPSGFSCKNPFKNKDIALHCYFSMALFVSYSSVLCQF